MPSLNGKTPPVLDGFTGEQRLFLGWAQVWRSNIRDEALRAQLTSNAARVGVASRLVQDEAWNERDPQLPKSRWWLSDGPFVGFRLVTARMP